MRERPTASSPKPLKRIAGTMGLRKPVLNAFGIQPKTLNPSWPLVEDTEKYPRDASVHNTNNGKSYGKEHGK